MTDDYMYVKERKKEHGNGTGSESTIKIATKPDKHVTVQYIYCM